MPSDFRIEKAGDCASNRFVSFDSGNIKEVSEFWRHIVYIVSMEESICNSVKAPCFLGLVISPRLGPFFRGGSYHRERLAERGCWYTG